MLIEYRASTSLWPLFGCSSMASRTRLGALLSTFFRITLIATSPVAISQVSSSACFLILHLKSAQECLLSCIFLLHYAGFFLPRV